MTAAGYPGSPGEQPERELSAFELLGLVPAAPPAPVAPAPVASAPVAPVLAAPAPSPAAPLSRREARLREQGTAPVAPTAQPYLPTVQPHLPTAQPQLPAVQPAPRPPMAVNPMALQAPPMAVQPPPAPALTRRAERAQPPTARLARRPPEPPVRASRPAAHSAPPRKGFGARLLSFGAMVFAATMLIGLTVPANAFYGPEGSIADTSVLSAEAVQSLSVSDDVTAGSAERADYGVTSWAEVLQQRYGSQSYDYTVGTGPIQWPFPFPVPISDGWGDRVAPCWGCSSFHQGIDFVPGAGQPIYAIADGVVTLHEGANWSYGNTVEIEHEIDGHIVTSKYAHMESGSVSLKVGDTIEVGDYIGNVGDTGASTGPHLHFEVWIDTVKVNPFTWLKANAAS